MSKRKILITSGISAGIWFLQCKTVWASDHPVQHSPYPSLGLILLMGSILSAMLVAALLLKFEVSEAVSQWRKRKQVRMREKFKQQFQTLTSTQIDQILESRTEDRNSAYPGNHGRILMVTALLSIFNLPAKAQAIKESGSWFTETGFLITIALLAIPILFGITLLFIKSRKAMISLRNRRTLEEAESMASYIRSLPQDELKAILLKRKSELEHHLTNHELGGNSAVKDSRGIIQVTDNVSIPFAPFKKKAAKRTDIDPSLSRLVIWYLVSATFWLLFGTTIGEYLGIKFVAPEADQISWLSFGRLRPVHTNAVFWGWASLAMIGLGYYIVPRVSNISLYSFKAAWYSLFFINAAVLSGTLSLMAGINNGGGEYREYVWPVMLLFGTGLILTLINFLLTIGKRTTTEIYISNWYIVSAVMFGLVIATIAYLPFWQNGLGETIIQGYYMHQGVGMWFMLFTLGIVYYFLPQQLNKPIYSYSLGILAFWAQILFYTLIGTHHFVFSSIPWWLQTVAIVGSAGMVIPVVAGTTNFLMTFKNAWQKISDSYTLPFFLTGIIFYFTGSLQGTAEAFRSANLYWHFTDFTVAHSHLTMYGIICFFLWAGIYAVIPRLTRKEPPQITVGAHFWLALIGLLFYTVPLMYGSTLKGLSWMEGKPFIESVTMMAPYWLWRAIGGSLMWLSHLFFAWNMYIMLRPERLIDLNDATVRTLRTQNTRANQNN